ncbi:hypothetical protein [Pararhodobacter zhoushanensis]|uniref:Uncharacterized protein n=1 Tax=Pararhodobacter zhoushanensis TaxID=2479545 RepID=A0ABT3H0M4_9RHOB|nr:hypothetical protein [Pararhodobacter zhoushanensis]MCW1933334.1 hypothetical protein [Pararhodobacter zhoushanensis]
MRDKPRDPAREKAKTNARQRKICSNSSDKASRKNAPRIKAAGNRSLRRLDKAALALAPEDAALQPEGLKTRPRPWGTDNAAVRRADRADERAWLDATPIGEGERPGRRRASLRHGVPSAEGDGN